MTRRRVVLGVRSAAVTLSLAGIVSLGIWGQDLGWGEPPTREAAVPINGGGPTDGSVPGVADGGDGPEAVVESAALGCPGVGDLAGVLRVATAPPEVLQSRAGVGASAGPDGQDPAQGEPGGAAVLRGVGEGAGVQDADDADLAQVEPGGSSEQVDLPGASGAVIEAGPGVAPGLSAAQLAVSAVPGERGALLAPCTQGAETTWLLGGGDGAGRSEQVVLTNPSADPVQVDLDVRDGDGVVEITGGSAIVVPPRGQVVQLLDALAPGVASPAVGVSSTGGSVVAHLLDQDREGTTDLGRAISTPAAAPAQDVIIPAVPTQGSELILRVLAPDAEAVVQVRALTEDGAEAPTTAVLRVPAEASADLPLLDLPDGAVGLRLQADTPIAAAVQVRQAPDGDEPLEEEADEDAEARDEDSDEDSDEESDEESNGDGDESTSVRRPAGDLAWVGAGELQSAPLATTLPRLPEDDADALTDTQLLLGLSAVDATTAQVLWLDEDGGTTAQPVDLDNDTSVLIEVPSDAVALWAVSDPGAPGLAAALHVSARDELGPYLAATALPPVPWTREVTQVVRRVP